MIEFVIFVLCSMAVWGGYVKTRSFVRDRLRFVDAVHRTSAPLVAGIGAALVASPVAWVLPFVGGGAAVLFGGAVGWGVVKGRRDIRQLPPG